MHEIKEALNIKNLIYEIGGKQMMLDSEMSVTKCHGNLYNKIVSYYDIGKPISMLINFADASAKIWKGGRYL